MDEALVNCPYCGEEIELFIDEGGSLEQAYIEDCQVCCRPMQIVVAASEDGAGEVFATRLDE